MGRNARWGESSGRHAAARRRRPLAVVAAALLLASCKVPNPSDAQRLNPADGVPRPARVISDVAYGPKPGQKLDVLLPQGSGTRRPTIVWIHGGGFVGGTENEIPPMVAAQLNRGFVVVAVRYRLAPADPFPAAVTDVKRAVRYLKANAGRFGVDPRKIVAWGHSAGGNLAAMLALSPGRLEPHSLPKALARQTSEVRAFVVESGPSDLGTWWRAPHPWPRSLVSQYLGCPGGDPTRCAGKDKRRASPLSYVDSSDPPAYLAYGVQDRCVPPTSQGEPFYRALVAAKGDSAVYWDLVDSAPIEAQGHNPEAGMNRAAVERFLALALSGEIS